jgi:hypothetical protein
VDAVLFDSYGQPEPGLHRVRSLVANDRVGSVAVYTWSLTKASRAAAYENETLALVGTWLAGRGQPAGRAQTDQPGLNRRYLSRPTGAPA